MVHEDLVVNLAQLRPRVDAQIVGEHAPGRLVQVQRVGLPTIGVEGAHQLRTQPLAKPILRDQGFQLDQDGGMLPAKEVGLDPVLRRRQPPLREVDRGCLTEGQIRHIDQRRTSPQAQRPPQNVGRLDRSTGRQLTPAQLDQLLELSDIDNARVDC